MSSPTARATQATTAPSKRGTLVTLFLTLSSGMLGGMREIEELAGLGSSESTPESICACVAKIFHVGRSEVALLEVSGRMLHFLYPAELTRRE